MDDPGLPKLGGASFLLALLLVKYCLLTGKASSPFPESEVCLGSATLALLRPGEEWLLVSEVATSVGIGSTGVSTGGP